MRYEIREIRDQRWKRRMDWSCEIGIRTIWSEVETDQQVEFY